MWTYFPLVDGDDQQLHQAVIELWEAMYERHMALDEEFWPRQNSFYERGDTFDLSGSHGAVVLDDSTKDWTVTPPSGCSATATRWFNYELDCPSGDNSNIAKFYDVIFDHADPSKVVRAQITDNTIDTLDLDLKLDDLIAQGVISSLSELESREYFIIKRDGLWWSDRRPNFPNPNVEWLGETTCVCVLGTAATDTTNFVGKIFRQAAQPDKTITAVGDGYIAIPWETPVPTGSFEVVDGATVLYSGTVGTTQNGIYELTDSWHGRNVWNVSRAVAWTDDEWTGNDVIVLGSDGKIKRIDITGNSANILFYASQTYSTAGTYAVVASGAFHMLGHSNMPIGNWYGGYMEPYLAHKPDDSGWPANISTVDKPMYSVEVKDASDPIACADPFEDWTKIAYDTDVWTGLDNVCDGWIGAELCYSPYLFKTLRGLQNDILGIAPNYVPVATYHSEPSIPTYVPARLFYAAGINHFSSTTAKVADGADWKIRMITPSGLPYSPITAYYTLIGEDGDNLSYGQATLTEGVPYYLGGGTPAIYNTADAAAYDARTVQWSFGFTRYMPREFRWWPDRKKTIFIPDSQTIEDAVVVYYPPEVADYCCDEFEEPPLECCRDCFGVGTDYGWVTQRGNNRYLKRDGYGFVDDTGDEWVEGDVARFVGNYSWSEAELGGVSTLSENTYETDKYYDRFYQGMHQQPDLQNAYDAQMVGLSTSATIKSISDTEKDWFDCWFGDSYLRTETGTATGGSSTTLVDSVKIHVETGDGNPLACWWKLDRQVDASDGGSIGYKHFILEVDKVVGDVTTTYKAVITGVNATTATITFSSVSGLTVASGDVYRIQESAELNRWNGRECTITYPDGTTVERTVTHNDDDTIWFDSDLPSIPPTGTSYRMREPIYGGVYQYDGTNWIPTEGTDARGEPFRADIRLNLPHKYKDYGPLIVGDYIWKGLLNEIYQLIDLLRWTKVGTSWTSDGEDNNRFCEESAVNGNRAVPPAEVEDFWRDENWVYIDAGLNTCYTTGTATEADGSAPSAYVATTLSDNLDSGVFLTAASLRRYAFPVASVTNLLNASVEAYAFAEKDCDGTPVAHQIRECEFDDYGDGLVENNYALVSTVAHTGTGDVGLEVIIGDQVGDDAIRPVYEPPFPTDSQIYDYENPPAPSDYVYSTVGWNGYVITAQTTIAKWDVTGGFVKVS